MSGSRYYQETNALTKKKCLYLIIWITLCDHG
jgi:hypothetical protein